MRHISETSDSPYVKSVLIEAVTRDAVAVLVCYVDEPGGWIHRDCNGRGLRCEWRKWDRRQNPVGDPKVVNGVDGKGAGGFVYNEEELTFRVHR